MWVMVTIAFMVGGMLGMAAMAVLAASGRADEAQDHARRMAALERTHREAS